MLSPNDLVAVLYLCLILPSWPFFALSRLASSRACGCADVTDKDLEFGGNEGEVRAGGAAEIQGKGGSFFVADRSFDLTPSLSY